MTKKMWKLNLAAVLAAVVIAFHSPMLAYARALGTWEYPTLILTSAMTFVSGATETHTGTETHSGAVTFSGATTLSGGVTTTGAFILSKTALTGISTGTAITYATPYTTVMSTSNIAVAMLMTPSIATTTVYGGATGLTSGTYLVLSSTGASGVTFYDNGTLAGSQLELGAASRIVTQYDTLTLIFDATDSKWREVSYGNN